MQRILLLILLSTLPLSLLAQKNYTISGTVTESASGEALIDADIFIEENGKRISTNNYGFYSITLPEGTYTIQCSYTSMLESVQEITLTENTKLDFSLDFEAESLEEVEVTTRRRDANVSSAEMGTNTLTAEQIKKMPIIFGEADVLKALQLLPGVQSAGEGNSGFYVRGGGPDQNLILLDEATVYNAGHLFGFFSVFNSDAIKKVTLTKGGMNANYGGRLSSALDVVMKEGNNQTFHAEGGIGLIASRLTVEGPLVKGKGSFLVSGRRTYIDVITKPFLKPEFKDNGYYFYDLNVKANYRVSDKDRLYLSGYFGRDVFNFAGQSGNFKARIPWGNATGTLRWNRTLGSKLFLNTSLIFNDYDFAFEGSMANIDVKLSSAIRDYGAKVDFDYFPNNNHKIKFGTHYTYHRFTPNQFSGKTDTMEFKIDNARIKFGHEVAFYAMDEFDIGERVKINAGLRYSMFTQMGPYTAFQFQDFQKTDSTLFTAGDPVVTYGGWEPRLNARFRLNTNASIKASISRNMQYLHLVSNNGSTLPTDVWVPSTTLVKPQTAWQYSVGYFQNLFDNDIETSIELYYKDLTNQIEYRNGYTQGLGDPEWDFVYGRGYAYGAEFLVNKPNGKLTGWIGYTLSWTWRQFDELNNGNRFPAKYDRRHDLSIVANYEVNKKWNFSSVFVFGTGNAITLPTDLYVIDGNLVQNFSELNQYRIPSYHRLDLSATWTPKGDKPNRKFRSSWNFSIYNVYSRLNPYFMYLDMEGALNSGGVDVKVMKVSIFPIIPSITWNFKF